MSESEAPRVSPPPPTPAGVLLIDKDVGPTSMQVCAAVRSRFRRGGAPKRIKVGHAGTLDPLATGLLIVLVGKATRLCDRFMADEKEYETTIDLAHFSDTDDAEGERTPVPCEEPPNLMDIQSAAARLTGSIQQTPPAYSAIHVDGQRAYRLARAGHAPVLPPRLVRVLDFEIAEYRFPLVSARIVCGKGTYIRSLARDMGRLLGTGGMLTQLRRTRIGDFVVTSANRVHLLPDPLLQEHLRRVDLTPPTPPPTG